MTNQAQIVLVPGIGNPAGVWDGVKQHLSEQGFEVSVVEVPGFGSDRSAIWLRSRRTAVCTLVKDIRASGPMSNTIVVGHSLGGMLTLRHAEHIGARGVIGVSVLLGETLRRLTHPIRLPDQLDARIARLVLGTSLPWPRQVASLVAQSEWARRLLLSDLVLKPERLDPAVLRSVLPGVGSVSSLSAILSPRFARHLMWWRQPPPSLGLVTGDQDAFMVSSDWKILEDLHLGEKRSLVLDRSGHWLPIERPKELATAIADLSRRL